ncbi:MAG: hypothetical protein JJE47_15705 [Acidimicrobiia bacterium]|nr:hypothetical protein [Acidimicrobiia bacterium]
MTVSREPLALIRAAELSAARSVAAETGRTSLAIADARREAAQLAEHARQRGKVVADERYARAITQAESRAADLAQTLDGRIRSLRTRIEPELDRLVEAMLDAILPRTE